MYDLVGIDGNAFSIMGYVRKAMRKEGYSSEEIEKYTNEAKSGDYMHLICVSQDMVEQLNKRL